ncbi:MAG: hypothetical protein WBW33_21130 [Bryobacteraceae bacterium]
MQRAIILLLLGLPACVSLHAEEKWIKLSTSHFEMFTPNGEKRAKEALQQFEQVRTFFRQATKKPMESGTSETRVRIVAFHGEKDYKPYRLNEGAAAFYLKNESHDYIVMGDVEEAHFMAAAHEYTHLVVEHAGFKFPVWLNEGLADVYSTLEARGDKTMVGRPIEGRLQVLQQTKWLELPALFAVGANSPYYNEKDKMTVFYAESWLLTHMLMLSAPYGPKFPEFLVAMNHGASAEAALFSVYGKDTHAVMDDLRHYMTGNTVRVSLVNVKFEKLDLETEVAAADELELRLTLADLLIGVHRFDRAKEALTRVSKEYTDQPQVEETWFDLALASQDLSGAADHCEQAFTLGSKNVQMLNNCIAVKYRLGGPSKNLIAMLQRVVELKPEDSETHVRLGVAFVDEQRYSAALTQFAEVKTVKPEMAYLFYSASGYAKLRLGDEVESRKDWELARKYAKTETQVQTAEQFLAELAKLDRLKQSLRNQEALPSEDPATSNNNPKSGLATQDDDPVPAGLLNRLGREEQQHVDGVLTYIDCDGQGEHLHLKTPSGELTFLITSPDDIRIEGADEAGSFTLNCGTKFGKNATVYYVVKADVPSVAGVARKLVLTK